MEENIEGKQGSFRAVAPIMMMIDPVGRTTCSIGILK